MLMSLPALGLVFSSLRGTGGSTCCWA